MCAPIFLFKIQVVCAQHHCLLSKWCAPSSHCCQQSKLCALITFVCTPPDRIGQRADVTINDESYDQLGSLVVAKLPHDDLIIPADLAERTTVSDYNQFSV